MNVHLPWGHEDYKMTVRLTRSEARSIITAMGESTDHRFQKLYEAMLREMEEVERIEADLAEEKEYIVEETFTYTVRAKSEDEAKEMVVEGVANGGFDPAYDVTRV